MTADATRIADVALVLPEHWWRIPLHPPQARQRSVDRLVQRQFAGIDNQPQLRAEARRQMLGYAESAAEADGYLLALSLLEVDGVAVPASLVLHWTTVPLAPEASPGDGSMLLALQDQIQLGPDARPPGYSLDLARVSAGHVLRRVHEQPGQLEGSDPVPSLVADYWLERPDGAGLVQLAFATPMVSLREPMLELFDSIASVLRWVTADERDRATTGGRRSGTPATGA